MINNKHAQNEDFSVMWKEPWKACELLSTQISNLQEPQINTIRLMFLKNLFRRGYHQGNNRQATGNHIFSHIFNRKKA